MKVLAENSILKAWNDGHSPILFMQFKSDFLGLIDILEAYVMSSIKPIKEMSSMNKEFYLLLDLSDVNCLEIENMIQNFEKAITKRIRSTFRFTCIVHSKSSSKMHKTQIPIGVFDSFFEALGAINNMRTKKYLLN